MTKIKKLDIYFEKEDYPARKELEALYDKQCQIIDAINTMNGFVAGSNLPRVDLSTPILNEINGLRAEINRLQKELAEMEKDRADWRSGVELIAAAVQIDTLAPTAIMQRVLEVAAELEQSQKELAGARKAQKVMAELNSERINWKAQADRYLRALEKTEAWCACMLEDAEVASLFGDKRDRFRNEVSELLKEIRQAITPDGGNK